MTIIPRWKLIVIGFVLGFSLVANLAQILLARQHAGRAARDIDARLSVAYAWALGEIDPIVKRPGGEDAPSRVMVLRTGLEGRLETLSGLGSFDFSVTGEAYRATADALDAAQQAAGRGDDASLVQNLGTLKGILFDRLAVLDIPAAQKDSIREAFQ